jgi:hypothetical protein
MSEPVKCPDCVEGQLSERGYETQYYGLYHGENGKLEVAPQPDNADYYEPDCYVCLSCGNEHSEDTVKRLLKEGPNV